MATTERVTVTLPKELVAQIDRVETNRSRFITEAVRRELMERVRAEFLRSLENPHPESLEMAELGFDDWARLGLDDQDLVDPDAGTPIRWVEGKGWEEVHR